VERAAPRPEAVPAQPTAFRDLVTPLWIGLEADPPEDHRVLVRQT